jgi:hypothetical protein
MSKDAHEPGVIDFRSAHGMTDAAFGVWAGNRKGEIVLAAQKQSQRSPGDRKPWSKGSGRRLRCHSIGLLSGTQFEKVPEFPKERQVEKILHECG